MREATIKLANHYRLKGKDELAQLVEDFDKALSDFSNKLSKETITTLYSPINDPLMVNATYCPRCNHAMTTRFDAEYVKENRMCIGCEQIAWDNYQDAKADYESRGYQ